MTAEEARAFESEMASNSELAELVRQHRLERQGLELLVERDLMAKMQAWDRETELFQQVQAHRTSVRPMTWILRAAAVLAVAALGYWMLRDDATSVSPAAPPVAQTKPEIKPRVPTVRRPNPAPPRRATPEPVEEQGTEIAQQDAGAETPAPVEEMIPAASAPDYAALANEFYRDQDFVPRKGSKGGNAGSAAYNQALDNFQDGKYNEVVSRLKPSLGVGADAIQQKELLALSLYKNQQYEAALPYFREVISSGKQPYAQRAEWALALSLLHQMPVKKPLFERVLAGILSNPEHLFHDQAQRLQARLQ